MTTIFVKTVPYVFAPVAVACDECGVLTTEGKIAGDFGYGPLYCPPCLAEFDRVIAEDNAKIEESGPTWQEIMDVDYVDFTPNNPDDGRMCRVSEWDHSRGYFMEDFDSLY